VTKFKEEKHINNDLISINYLKIFWGSL